MWSYWSDNTHNNIIKNYMSVMFLKTLSNRDRDFKVNPLIDTLNKKFGSLHIEKNLSLDEQLCPTKAVSYISNSNPLLSLINLATNYLLYVGFLAIVINLKFIWEIKIWKMNELYTDFGVTGNSVVSMTGMIPENVHHKLFFDNYYTSLPVMIHLKKRHLYIWNIQT